jgi:hypothetical protein
VDAATASSGGEGEHADRARSAAAVGRAILDESPPLVEGSLQMETPWTYLAFADAELSRLTGSDPALWSTALGHADFVYSRLYAKWRLVEALFDSGDANGGEEVLRDTHAEAAQVGADLVRRQLEALALENGLIGLRGRAARSN